MRFKDSGMAKLKTIKTNHKELGHQQSLAKIIILMIH